MLTMNYRLVDTLQAFQLEEGDLVDIGGDICKIISKQDTKDGYALIFEDEFGEKDVLEIFDDEIFYLYMP